MYNEKKDNLSLINAIAQYITRNQLPVNDSMVLDTLLENEDIQRLLFIWLQAGNERQLQYFLVHTVDKLSLLSDTEQKDAISKLLRQAQQLNVLIPTPSDLDIVLDSMGEVRPKIDGWSDLNVLLADLSDEDIKKIEHLVFFINQGLFTANLVAGMSIAQIAEFDARVKTIIEEQADFIYPSRIFSDKLIKLLKEDLIIQRILASVKPVEPLPLPPISQHTESNAILDEADKLQENRDLLAKYLGLDDDDSSINTVSETQSSANTSIESKDSALPSPRHSNTLTFWQRFNIETHQLQSLIQKGEINPFEIPDRELTEQEAGIYLFMNRLNEDLFGPTESISSTNSTSDATLTSKTSRPASHSTAEEYPTAEPKRKPHNKESFIPVIKEDTHNIQLKLRNQNQRQWDYLGKDTGRMPRWHKEAKEYRAYKERMRAGQNLTPDDTDQSQDSSKLSKKSGKSNTP